VDAHSGGVSPFGVWDGVGNVWQMTNEYYDDHTSALVVCFLSFLLSLFYPLPLSLIAISIAMHPYSL
jgi:hypothetical protein